MGFLCWLLNLSNETLYTTYSQGICPTTARGMAIRLSLQSPNQHTTAPVATIYVWTKTTHPGGRDWNLGLALTCDQEVGMVTIMSPGLVV